MTILENKMLKTLWWCLLISAIVICANGQEGKDLIDPQVNVADPNIGEETTPDGSTTSEGPSDLAPPAPDGVLPAAISEAEMVKILKKYNNDAAEVCNTITIATWNAATDVGNKEKEEQKVRQTKIFNVKSFGSYDKNCIK